MAPNPRRSQGTQSSQGSALPLYQRPLAPLDVNATDQVRNMKRMAHFNEMRQLNANATAAVTDISGDVRDAMRSISALIEKRRGQVAQMKEEKENDPESHTEQKIAHAEDTLTEHQAAFDEFQPTAEQLSEGQEECIRALIDQSERTEETRTLVSNLPQDLRRAAESRDTDGDTDMDGGQGRLKGPSSMLKEDLRTWQIQRDARSLASRYASHNDYRHYKSAIHHGIHGDDAPPLPNPSTWFEEEEGASDLPPDLTQPHRTQSNQQDDDDSDIEVARTRVSLHCPLTLRIFEDPLSSKKCPHSFERSAILELIEASTVFINTLNALQDLHGQVSDPRGDRATRCPSTGCEVMICEADLEANPTLKKRAAKQLRREGRGRGNTGASSDIEEDGGRDGTGITIDDEENQHGFASLSQKSRGSRLAQIKQEQSSRRSTPRRRAR